MRYKEKILVILSSVFLNLALILPNIFYILVFFYLVPLFYLADTKNLNFINGLLWGISFYLIHFYYIFVLIHEKAEGEFKLIVPFLVVLYFSLYSILWFWMTCRLSCILKYPKITFFFVTLLHTWLIYNFVFWIFQEKCGYVFSFPLLPLFCKPNLLTYLIIPGLWFCMGYIIFLNLCLYLSFKNIKFISLYFILLGPLLIGLLKKEPEIKNKFIYSIMNHSNITHNPYVAAQTIKFKIINLIKENPIIKAIFMPESAFPYPLNLYPEIIEWWYCDLEKKDIHIILGSHRKDKNLYNTVYHLYKGKIVNYYDKTNLMFFTEKIPNLCKNFPVFSNLFLKNNQEFSPGSLDEVCFNVEGAKGYIYICSDFFLQKEIKGNEIWLFMNDSWFTSEYIKKLIVLYINLMTHELKKRIICINLS